MKERYNKHKFFFEQGTPDYEEYEKRIYLLKASVAISNTFIYIKDLYSRDYPYFTALPLMFSGYSESDVVEFGSRMSEKLLSKEDYDFVCEMEELLFTFIDDLAINRRKHLVGTICHEFLHKEGYPYSVILKATPFLFDDEGNVWMMMYRMNIAPKKFERFFHIDMDDTKEHFVFNDKKELEVSQPIKLTKSEINILYLSNRGMLEKEMCEELHISLNTLKTHKRNILRKLWAENIHEAFYLASLNRLL